ncbi:Carboxylesterase [Dendryphion nanum]|uniref:Carboxylic ester hydrolase n=1 Tax=Dendryphion nanum TaxID=256645 RepID=A0A9P9IV07_9PLEO|nr:Carboxylesterase [Dendryphion nanum]
MLTSILILAATTVLQLTHAQTPSVTVSNGVFIGTATTIPGTSQRVRKFLGLPYAVTPPLRFSPPQPPPPSSIVRQAINYGPGCIQQGAVPDFPGLRPLPVTPPPDSEDCLYVNIYAPDGPVLDGGRAVMIWFYGGAFSQGTSGISVFDGSYLAASGDVIVVSFNYRTNVFGFPGLIPGLPLSQTNLGLLDQRLAFQWVKQNIAAFGGDPSKITLFGESAGAVSVDLLYLTTPPTNPPFRAAILQSGTYFMVDNAIGLLGPRSNSSLPPIQQLAAAVNCLWDATTLSCLRSKTPTTLKSASESLNLPWQPTPDEGNTVPTSNHGHKVRALFRGARVPILLGTNANEALMFLLGSPSTFDFLFSSQFPELAPYQGAIRASYPIGGCSAAGCFRDELAAVVQVVTDYIFTCPAAREARVSALTLVPTYRYLYNQTQPFLPFPLNSFAFHAAELPLVFGTLDPGSVTPAVAAISRVMMQAWTEFAKNPVAGGGFKRYTSIPFLGEIGELGGPRAPNGVAAVDNTVVDGSCWIYSNIYQRRDPVF